jgi:hypothetical protein
MAVAGTVITALPRTVEVAAIALDAYGAHERDFVRWEDGLVLVLSALVEET